MVVRFRLEANEILMFCIVNSNGVAKGVECVARARISVTAVLMQM